MTTVQVLPARVIHRGLSSHARVNLRKQRGRDLHQRNTPEIRRGDEPGEIAERTPSESHQDGLTVGSKLEKGVVHARRGPKRLGPLAVRDLDPVRTNVCSP